jgi:Zn-dependent M28 family amino/carboxypeptidase
VNDNDLRRHVIEISAAEKEGITPGSPGEARAMRYFQETLRGFGLNPYLEKVPLVTLTSGTGPISITGKEKKTLSSPSDFIGWTRRQNFNDSIDADVVFAGYGISASSDDWDDYKDPKKTSVRGKLVLVLIGGPETPEGSHPNLMKDGYYSGPTYKFLEAAAREAAGVLIIHNPEDAGADWGSIASTDTDAVSMVQIENEGVPRLPLEGWINRNAAKDLFSGAGVDFEDLASKAAEANFRPVELPIRASLSVHSTMQRITPASTNVVATIEGKVPGTVVYSSHWNDVPPGISVNIELASRTVTKSPPGAAILLEIARAFAHSPKPARSITFIISTAVPSGLKGLVYFVERNHGMNNALALIHVVDFGVTPHREVRTIGRVFPALNALLRNISAEQYRYVLDDQDATYIHYFRYSQVALDDKGVPNMFVSSVRRGKDPPVEGDSGLDSTVGILDVQLLFRVGTAVSESKEWGQLLRSSSNAESPQRRQ